MNTIERYCRAEGTRDFQTFPQTQLEIILNQIEVEAGELDVRNRLDHYFGQLVELGAEPELVALVGHAVTSYLENCLANGEPWAAKFLFPPELDPTEIVLDGETAPAVEQFKERHLRRNLEHASRQVVDLIFHDTVLFINGPMFSAKSGAAALMYGLLSKSVGQENVVPLIFSGMGESSIHARSLPNGAIDAEPVDLAGLRQVVNKLISQPLTETGIEGKRVVIIEEATFFEMDDAGLAAEFAAQVSLLKQNGISVILIGLGKNYRGLELLITETVLGSCPEIQTLDCTSFHLFAAPQGNQVLDAELTGRYSQTLQMFDWCFPILVPRALAHGIDYHPLPSQYHPLDVLHRNDPELFEQLRGLQRHDLLAKHTEVTLQQEA